MICRKPASIDTHESGYLFSMDPTRVWVVVFKNVNLQVVHRDLAKLRFSLTLYIELCVYTSSHEYLQVEFETVETCKY